MGNGQLSLSVSYLKKQALPEGYAEPQLTYDYQKPMVDCHSNTSAWAFILNFDGMNLIYVHSLSPGAANILPACVPSEVQMNETHEIFPMREISLMVRKIQVLNFKFQSPFFKFPSNFWPGISWNVSQIILDLNDQFKGKSFPKSVMILHA